MRKRLLLLTAIACVLSVAFAAVFVFFPANITMSFASPPVIFLPGKNANQPDIGQGNTIGVTVGDNKTSVSITLHPTYQKTYYQNITLVKNVESGAGSKAYNLWFKVNTPVSGLPAGSQAKLLVYQAGAARNGAPILTVDLTSSGVSNMITLNANSFYEIDFFVVYPEGQRLPQNPVTASLELIFSPQSETPPTYP